jgi:hypothetical protein
LIRSQATGCRCALFLELAVAEDEDAVEIAGEARLMQNPNYAPASELLVQSLDHPRLRLPSEASSGLQLPP